MAYENYSSSWAAKESHKLVFPKSEVPAAENNYALCMVSIFCLISMTLEFMLNIRVEYNNAVKRRQVNNITDNDYRLRGR